MSDFTRLPTQNEVAEYDLAWISDMRLMQQLYSHQNNNSPVMKLYQEYIDYKENPAAHRAQNEMLKHIQDNDAAVGKAFNADQRGRVQGNRRMQMREGGNGGGAKGSRR